MLEKIKSKYFIFKVTIIFLILVICVLSFLLYKETTKKSKNPYDIKVKSNDNFVFLGDSITDYYPLEELYDGYPVINSGVAGYTTSDILNNLDKMVPIYNPTKVFLLIGTNDIDLDKSDKYIINNITKIINNIKKKRPKTKIYIESIYPVNNTNDSKINHATVGIRNNKRIIKLNKKIKAYCDKNNYTYIDVYSNLVDKDGNLKIEYTEEGLHLTDLGYLKVTKILYPYLED